MESALTTSPFSRWARAMESAVLPEAVGPAMTITVPGTALPSSLSNGSIQRPNCRSSWPRVISMATGRPCGQ